MPLEATMFCLDNSDWMRNGDYNPTRLAAQNDTVHKLATAQLRDNSESTTGFLSMAGSKVDVHLSPCKDMGKMLNSLKSLIPSGTCDILNALKIAQLTLKNRQNKTQRQRIILFVGSPISCSADDLSAAGKQLKKNNVAVDIVHFGTENSSNDNTEKLEALIAAVNNSDNSHLVTVPPGPHRLSDMVLCSPVSVTAPVGGSGRVGGEAGVSGAATFDELDSLMETDPELALALRMSLEDAGIPQAAPAATESTSSASSSTVPATPVPAASANAGAAMEDFDDDDEEAALAAAIALSLQMEQEAANEDKAPSTVEATPAQPPVAATPAAPAKSETTSSKSNAITDTPAPTKNLMDSLNADLMSDLLAQVAEGELDEADIQDILASLGQEESEDKDKQKEEK